MLGGFVGASIRVFQGLRVWGSTDGFCKRIIGDDGICADFGA